MTETRKLLSLFTGITFVAFLAFQSVSMTNVSATYGGGDNCNQETTYTVDEDDESHLSFSETGNRVDVDFNGGDDDRNQAVITAGSGYQIITVRYDNETSNTNWINFSVANPTTTINLAGTSDTTRIDKVEVKVKKVCASPTPSTAPTAIPTSVPTQAPTAIPTAIPTTAPTAVPTSVPTTAPTAVPTSIPSVTPVVTVAVDPSVSPEPTVTGAPTVTPTDTPSSSTNNNNNSSSNNSSSNNEVKVAGISALASTGGIIDSLMNSVFVSGLLTFAFGLKRHGKKS